MATSRQVVDVLDEAFGLAGTGRIYANHLRSAGMLPSSQGKPQHLAPEHTALILLSILLGEPLAKETPARVATYAALQPASDHGPTLGTVLAGFIARPHDMFELRVDLETPFASMVVRQADRGMATLIFSGGDTRVSPVERTATLTGGTLVSISAAIDAAPEVRAGRRRRHRKH